MKNAVLVLVVILAVIGMVIGAGIIWIVLYNLFHGFGMNWLAGIAGCAVFGVFNAIYNKVTGEC